MTPPTPVERTVVCPVCSTEMTKQNPSWLFRCERCGLLGSRLEVEIDTSNPTHSVIDEQQRERALNAVRDRNNSRILEYLQKRGIEAGARLLDVGCGHGQMLLAAQAKGLLATGIEPDRFVFESVTRNHHGLKIRSGFFPQVLEANELFDVIVFNDVLEHIPDVHRAFAACRQHLAPRGFLVINSPSQRGVIYRIASVLRTLGVSGPFDRMWQKGMPSPHVWYFTPEHIRELGERYGLSYQGKQELMPIGIRGLWDRCSYVRSQSRTLTVVSYLAALAAFFPLYVLPKDSVAVYFEG